jgi:hypothetical protein
MTGLTTYPRIPSALYENTRTFTPICGAASPARPGSATVSTRSRTSARSSAS